MSDHPEEFGKEVTVPNAFDDFRDGILSESQQCYQDRHDDQCDERPSPSALATQKPVEQPEGWDDESESETEVVDEITDADEESSESRLLVR